MSYNAVKTFLWIALGGALGYAGLLDHSGISSLLIAGVAVLLVGWLARHPIEIKRACAARVAKGQEYIRESRTPWKRPPNPHLLMAILLLVGLCCLSATFPASSPNIHGYL